MTKVMEEGSIHVWVANAPLFNETRHRLNECSECLEDVTCVGGAIEG